MDRPLTAPAEENAGIARAKTATRIIAILIIFFIGFTSFLRPSGRSFLFGWSALFALTPVDTDAFFRMAAKAVFVHTAFIMFTEGHGKRRRMFQNAYDQSFLRDYDWGRDN
jgi:hypothetical protein